MYLTFDPTRHGKPWMQGVCHITVSPTAQQSTWNTSGTRWKTWWSIDYEIRAWEGRACIVKLNTLKFIMSIDQGPQGIGHRPNPYIVWLFTHSNGRVEWLQHSGVWSLGPQSLNHLLSGPCKGKVCRTVLTGMGKSNGFLEVSSGWEGWCCKAQHIHQCPKAQAPPPPCPRPASCPHPPRAFSSVGNFHGHIREAFPSQETLWALLMSK